MLTRPFPNSIFHKFQSCKHEESADLSSVVSCSLKAKHAQVKLRKKVGTFD